MLKKMIYAFFILVGLVLTLGSQGAYQTSLGSWGSNRPTLTMGSTSWDDSYASTYVLKQVFEEAGYDVTVVELDPSVLFSALATGEIDISSAAWLPATHGAYYQRFSDQIVDLGPHATDAITGLTVPSYMEVDRIDQLTNQAGQVITGIEPGAGIANQTDEALEIYPNLSGWTHQTSSTGAMLTELDQAIQNEEEIVVTGWTPHWMFLEMDLKFLEDPMGAYGEGENLQKLSRLGFEDDHPLAYHIFDRFEWTVDDIGLIMADLGAGLSPEQAAAKWIEENPDQVEAWLAGIEDLE